MDDYTEAVAKLQTPESWCDGAAQLAKLGDSRALLPLVRAYRARAEVSKTCLLEAMDALSPRDHAAEMWAAGDRVEALDLMRLFPDDAHLPLLSAAVEEDDALVRFTALRAIGAQIQTPAWIAAMIPLLSSDRLDVREQAVDRLARRDEPEVLEALRARAEVEPDPALKARLSLLAGP